MNRTIESITLGRMLNEYIFIMGERDDPIVHYNTLKFLLANLEDGQSHILTIFDFVQQKFFSGEVPGIDMDIIPLFSGTLDPSEKWGTPLRKRNALSYVWSYIQNTVPIATVRVRAIFIISHGSWRGWYIGGGFDSVYGVDLQTDSDMVNWDVVRSKLHADCYVKSFGCGADYKVGSELTSICDSAKTIEKRTDDGVHYYPEFALMAGMDGSAVWKPEPDAPIFAIDLWPDKKPKKKSPHLRFYEAIQTMKQWFEKREVTCNEFYGSLHLYNADLLGFAEFMHYITKSKPRGIPYISGTMFKVARNLLKHFFQKKDGKFQKASLPWVVLSERLGVPVYGPAFDIGQQQLVEAGKKGVGFWSLAPRQTKWLLDMGVDANSIASKEQKVLLPNMQLDIFEFFKIWFVHNGILEPEISFERLKDDNFMIHDYNIAMYGAPLFKYDWKVIKDAFIPEAMLATGGPTAKEILRRLSSAGQEQVYQEKLDDLFGNDSYWPKEDWNFTSEQYRLLRKANVRLQMALPHSAWWPMEWRENLIAAIDHVLSHRDYPEAVNFAQFCKGHFCLALSDYSMDVIKAKFSAFESKFGQIKAAFLKDLGQRVGTPFTDYPSYDERKFPKFFDHWVAATNYANDLYRDFLKTELKPLNYTFVYQQAAMAKDNDFTLVQPKTGAIQVLAGSALPHPGDPNNLYPLYNYRKLYYRFFSFYFQVNKSGQVFVGIHQVNKRRKYYESIPAGATILTAIDRALDDTKDPYYIYDENKHEKGWQSYRLRMAGEKWIHVHEGRQEPGDDVIKIEPDRPE